MTPDILDYIAKLSASDKKTLSQKALKTAEEVGELAKVVLPYDNAASTTHRFVNSERILEEVCDTVLCALSVAYDLGFSTDDISSMMMNKASYWAELQSREQKVTYPLPYEIHVTVGAGETGIDIEEFKNVCRQIGVKPLLIDMHNRQGKTVMLDAQTSSVHMGNNRTALKEAMRIKHELYMTGIFDPVRVKIETVPWHPAAPSKTHANPVMPPNCYFEAHFNIIVNEETHSQLQNLLARSKLHLSRNAFKKLNDKDFVIMATLRHYEGTYEEFESARTAWVQALKMEGFEVPKTITEFSVYDTKISHDASWLVQ